MSKSNIFFLLLYALFAGALGVWVTLPTAFRYTTFAQGTASIVASVDILPLIPTVSEVSFSGTAGAYNILAVNVVGAGFAANGSSVTARLERVGYEAIVMDMAQVALPTALVGTFDVTGVAAGVWSITVQNAFGVAVSPSPHIFFELPITSSQRIVVSGAQREMISALTESNVVVRGTNTLRIITPAGFIPTTGAALILDLKAFSSATDFIGMGKPIAPSAAISGNSAMLVGDVYSIDLRRNESSIHTLLKPAQLAFLYQGGNITSIFPAWYDESAAIWRIIDGRSIDVAANTIFVDTPHFSIFGLVRDMPTPAQASIGGGGSGSGFSMSSSFVANTSRTILPSLDVSIPSNTISRTKVAYDDIPRIAMKFGSRGATVKQLQRLLIAYAPDLGPSARALMVTGNYLAGTRAAVTEFQLFLARGASPAARALAKAVARKEGVGVFGMLTRAAVEEFLRL